MSIFYPHYRYKRIYDIPLDFFISNNIKSIILDVDNTLTTHGNPVPSENVEQWLDTMRQNNIKMMIVSNNKPKRVKPFAQLLKLDFVANGAKPLVYGIKRAASIMQSDIKHTALIGDQIFTDILGGRLSGCITILVEPIELEKNWFIKLKRIFEKMILKKYNSKGAAK